MESSKVNYLQYKEDLQIPVPWGILAAKVWGPDDGLPVLALHGWQDNAGSFDTLAHLLPVNTRLVCLEFCGHGYSSHYHPGMFLSLYDHIYHVKLVIDFFKWEEVTLMGHSMGGQIALFVASIFPDKIHKLISLDAIKLRSSSPDSFIIDMKAVINDFQNIVKKIENVSWKSSVTTYNQAREKLVKNYSGSVEAEHADILLARSLRKTGEDEYEYTRDLRTVIRPFLFNDFTTEKLKEIARGIKCPFLLIKAKHSVTSVSSERIELHQEFLDIYRNASSDFHFVQVNGTHHVHLTHPEVVAPYICNFLRKNVA